jgi:hypothetical protein
MKKILLIAIAAFMVNEVIAQNEGTDFRNNLQFGLKLGLNRSNVYASKGEQFDANPKFGLALGAFVVVPLGEFIGIQPEMIYSQKGFKATGMLLGNTYNITRTTSYLDVPILFALKPGGMLTLLVGPQYSYLLKQKDVFANTSTSIQQEQEFENANVRKNILCFVGGFDINLNHLVLGGRIGWDILRNNKDKTSETPRYKNVWYQVTLGYRFY